MEEDEIIDAQPWPYESTFKIYNPGDKDVLIRIMNDGESVLLPIPASEEKPIYVRLKDGKQYKVPCSLAKTLYEQGKAFYTTKPSCELEIDKTGLSTTIWLNEFLHKEVK
jgi:hypothetical protein